MNPDKLFNYLDGKLSPADRAEVEEKLMSDPHLRKEFEVAREIHRSGRAGREVIALEPEPTPSGGRLGRQILTAAFVLVVLNVAGGLAIIGWKFNHRPTASKGQEQLRAQVEQSLAAAGSRVLPPPSLNDDRIDLAMPRAQWDQLATQVVAAAESVGGLAPREDRAEAVIIMATVPRSRMGEFRRLVLGPNATSARSAGVSDSVTIEVRIAETAQ